MLLKMPHFGGEGGVAGVAAALLLHMDGGHSTDSVDLFVESKSKKMKLVAMKISSIINK